MQHALIGAGLSLLAMLALAAKWKLPRAPALLGAIGTSLVAAAAFVWVRPLRGGWGAAAAVLGQAGVALILGLALVMWRFWRDPERVPPSSRGIVLAAADGRVLYVRGVDEGATPLVTKGGRSYRLEELTGTRLVSEPAHVVGIEMSFLDVHVNRCPVSGWVRHMDHIGGTFLSLRRDEAPFVNERVTTVIENGALAVAVVQVASRLVRRIESYLTPGMAVAAGQRLGIIRLGSLVAVVIPKREGVAITVRPGDRVRAGISPLALYPEGDEGRDA